MAGFFDVKKWKDEPKSSPVNAIPVQLDHLIYNGRPCTSYLKEKLDMKTKPEYKALLQKYQELFKYLKKYSGKSIRGFRDVRDIYDILLIEKASNFTQVLTFKTYT